MSEPWFKVIPQEQIPSVFPKSFRAKMDHAVVMGSGDGTGKVYLVVNAQRVDTKASAIDQEPFGVVFDNGVPSESGVFIHHGVGKDERKVASHRTSGPMSQQVASATTTRHRVCQLTLRDRFMTSERQAT